MLMEQALVSMGYDGVSEQLAAESGIKHETPMVAAFRAAVLEGQYGLAVDLLDKLDTGDGSTVGACKFLVLEQKYLEVTDSPHPAVAVHPTSASTIPPRP